MKTLIFCLFLLSPFVCCANKYDDEETLRRFAERIEEKENQERQAAKERYNRQQYANSDNSEGGFYALMFIGGGLLIYICKKMEK